MIFAFFDFEMLEATPQTLQFIQQIALDAPLL